MANFVFQHALNDDQLDALSPSARGFYGRNQGSFMRLWNDSTKRERARSLEIISMQKSLGDQFAPLADAMLADDRYTAEDLAKVAYTKISADMGNWQARARLAETETAATAEWEKSSLVRATFHNKKADYIAFRAYSAAKKGGAR